MERLAVGPGSSRRRSAASARAVSSSLYLRYAASWIVGVASVARARGRRASGCSARSGPPGRSRASCRSASIASGIACRRASSTEPRLFHATRSSGNFARTALQVASRRPSSAALVLRDDRSEERRLAPAGPALLGLGERRRGVGEPALGDLGAARGSRARPACRAPARRPSSRRAPRPSGRPGGRARCRSRSSAATAGSGVAARASRAATLAAAPRRARSDRESLSGKRRHGQRRTTHAPSEKRRVVARELAVVDAGRERRPSPSRPSGPSAR